MEIKTNGFKLPSGDIHVFIPPEPTETDRGGIKASEKTTESLEVKYDKKTGKLFSPTSPTDNTLTKSNVAADAKKTGDEFARVNNNMESKLDKQQGVVNKGKALVVGDDGNVVVGEVQSSGNADIIKALQDALISQVVNGESINVSDSSRLPVEEFALSGKLEQLQTTGANLFDISKAVVNLSKLKAWAGTAFDTEFVMKTFKPNTKYFVKYKIKMIKAVTEKKLYDRGKSLLMYKAGGTTATIIREKKEMKDGEVITGSNIFTTPSDLQDYKILAYTERYTEEDGTGGFFSEIAIEELIISEQDVPYEPYTGGKPSPRPDYPQPIETTPRGIITVDFTDGTNHQIVELNCPREFTKWDRLEKIDGVWNWVFKAIKDTDVKQSRFDLFGWNHATQYKDFKNGVYAYVWSFKNKEKGWQTSICKQFKNENGSYDKGILWHYSDNPAMDRQYFVTNHKTVEEFEAWVEANPLTMYFEGKETEYVPLLQEEQDKLNALTMYAPNTEITNTGGCNMELTYTVDTKAYVDAKIASVVKSVVETQKALL